LIAALGIVALFIGVFLSSEAGVEWRVSLKRELLDYRRPAPEVSFVSHPRRLGASSLHGVPLH